MLSIIQNRDLLDRSPFVPFQGARLDPEAASRAAAGARGDVFFGDPLTDTVEVSAYRPQDGPDAPPVAWRALRSYRVSGAGELLVPLYRVAREAGLAPGATYDIVMSFQRKVVWPEGSLDGAASLPQAERVARLRRNLGADVGYKVVVGEMSRDRTEVRIRPVRVGAPVFDDAFAEAFAGFFSGEGTPLRYNLNLGRGLVLPVAGWLLDRAGTPAFPHSAVLKLVRPAPAPLSVGSEGWVDETVMDPLLDRVVVPREASAGDGLVYLSAPDYAADPAEAEGGETGRRAWEDILDEGDVRTTEQVLARLVDGRDRPRLNVDYGDFSAFVHFGSAEELVANFAYKMRVLADTRERADAARASAAGEAEALDRRAARLVESLSSYERHLFTSPAFRDQQGEPLDPDSPAGRAFLSSVGSEAARYDASNRDSLRASLPEYVRADPRSADFVRFVDMMGEYFDLIWLRIRHMRYRSDRSEGVTEPESLSRDLIRPVAAAQGVDLFNGFDVQDLFAYAFDESDGRLPFSPEGEGEPGEIVQQQVWRRVLSSSPWIARARGTDRSVRALLNAYGIPRIGLTVREYGGGSDSDAPGFLRIEDVAYALGLAADGEVRVGADPGAGPVRSVEVRFRSSYQGSAPQAIARVPGAAEVASVEEPGDPRMRRLRLGVPGGGPSVVTDPLPLADGRFAMVSLSLEGGRAVVRSSKPAASGPVGTQARPAWSVEASLDLPPAALAAWDDSAGPQAVVMPGARGDVDVIRLWSEPLPRRTVEAHAMAPAGYARDNREAALHALDVPFEVAPTLLLDVDVSEPMDLSSGGTLPLRDVGNDYGGQVQVTPLTPTPSRPWQFVRIERESLAEPVKAGARTLTSAKTRVVASSLSGALSPDERREIGDPDTTRRDSPVLGVFLYPLQGVNDDITLSLGAPDINDLLADPDERFSEGYRALDAVRRSYWSKYDRPVDWHAYIRYVEGFNRALFKRLRDLTPARSAVKRGVLIEPHLLERSRLRQTSVTRERLGVDALLRPAERLSPEAVRVAAEGLIPVDVPAAGASRHLVAELRPVDALRSNMRFFGNLLPETGLQTRQAPDLYPEGTYWIEPPSPGRGGFAGVRNPDSLARERRLPPAAGGFTVIDPVWESDNIFHTTFFQNYGSFTVYAGPGVASPPGAVYSDPGTPYSAGTGAEMIRTRRGLIPPPARPYERYRHYLYNREFRTPKRRQLYEGMRYDSSVDGVPAVEITSTRSERLIVSPSDREPGSGPVLDVR